MPAITPSRFAGLVLLVLVISALLADDLTAASQRDTRPNLILVMSDDQGWGDIGYNGNKIVQTPNLDRMSREAIRLDRFYAAAPVCSPTRGSCLTGRHPYRYGVFWLNVYPLPVSELTLPEVLRAAGYRTGHFGKWHLGTMTADATKGPTQMLRPIGEFSPPWINGFETCFSAEVNGPTYNPMVWGRDNGPGNRVIMNRPVAFGETTEIPGVVSWGIDFWTGPGMTAKDNLAGDSSKIIMDRALEFIEHGAAERKPFLAVIWFFAPHSPIAAGNSHRAPYHERSMEEQHWFGCITAMDEQVGRLRQRLRELNIAGNTALWFCSDNGPSWVTPYNSAGPYRGEKGLLYEGGVRVPSILEWPARYPSARVIDTPICTSDFFPTLLDWAQVPMPKDARPLDGIDATPLLDGTEKERPSPIAFESPTRMGIGHDWMTDPDHWKMNPDPATTQLALTGNRYKLISPNNGKSWELYDLKTDPSEKSDVANLHFDVVQSMRAQLLDWVASCDRSRSGADYK